MNLDVLIPQIWYDFIGRIVPGTYVLGYLMWLHQMSVSGKTSLTSIIPVELNQYSFLATFITLTIAYLIGALAGAIWLWVEDKFPIFNKKHLVKVMTKEEENLVSIHVIHKTQFADYLIPFIYDYIQLGFPKMGARIAKLRGEQHLCGTLILCSVFIGFYNLTITNYQLFSIIPFLVVFLSTVFYRHLIDRLGKSMINGWGFLRKGLSEK